MLARFVSVVAGMALPFLLIAACALVLNVGDERARPARTRGRWWAVGGGLAAGTVFAVLRATAVVTSRTAVNLPTLAACAVADLALIASLSVVVVSGAKAERRGSSERAAAVSPRTLTAANAVACVALALTFFRASPDVVLQLTSFIEPGEKVLSSTMLLRVLGFLAGWVAVALVAAIYQKAGGRAPRAVAGAASIGIAAVALVAHLTQLLQLLHASHRIQLSGAPFRALVALVNAQNTVVIVACGVLFLAPLVAAALTWRPRPLAPNAAQERLAQATATHTRRWFLASAAGFALVVLTLTVGEKQINQKVTLSDPEPYTVDGGFAVIPLISVEDGHLHRYAYQATDGTPMRFIIVRKSGGAYGVALDACESCGPVGYYEKNGKIICKACDVAINVATIGFRGGCNPIPIDFTVTDGQISIATATLDAVSSVFA